MNILFLSTYPLEKGPSQRFRIGLYLPELEKEGHKCSYAPFYSEAAWNILFSKGNFIPKARTLIPCYFKRTKLLFTLSQWDIIFMECCLHDCNAVLESLSHFWMHASIEVNIALFLLSAVWAAGVLFAVFEILLFWSPRFSHPNIVFDIP